MTDFNLRSMTLDDYDVVYALWQSISGIGLSASDERDAIAAFLERNPGFSAVVTAARAGIVGVVLCGHDGRRGYLHHLAVQSQYRKHGIAKMLSLWYHYFIPTWFGRGRPMNGNMIQWVGYFRRDGTIEIGAPAIKGRAGCG